MTSWVCRSSGPKSSAIGRWSPKRSSRRAWISPAGRRPDAEAFVEQAPAAAGGTGPPAHWLERGRPSRRTSVVIDPPNGRIPYLDEEARQRSARAVNARTTGPGPFQGPEDLDLYDRCITRGLPHVIFPTIYNNTSAIVQGPGYVGIRYEMIHDVRIVPLDGRPHLSPGLRHYFGDSRGRWDGDTLVVDVTNFPTGSINYRGAGARRDLTERFRRVARTVRYESPSNPAIRQAMDSRAEPRRTTGDGRVRYACPKGTTR
jgi:hypothetical protein